MAQALVDREEIAAELERARAEFHELLVRAAESDFDHPSNGTRWTNEQSLFHMVFGFMVVARLQPLVRVLGRLPAPVSRSSPTTWHSKPYIGIPPSTSIFIDVN